MAAKAALSILRARALSLRPMAGKAHDRLRGAFAPGKDGAARCGGPARDPAVTGETGGHFRRGLRQILFGLVADVAGGAHVALRGQPFGAGLRAEHRMRVVTGDATVVVLRLHERLARVPALRQLFFHSGMAHEAGFAVKGRAGGFVELVQPGVVAVGLVRMAVRTGYIPMGGSVKARLVHKPRSGPRRRRPAGHGQHAQQGQQDGKAAFA